MQNVAETTRETRQNIPAGLARLARHAMHDAPYGTVERCGRLAQLVRAPPLHGGCRGFESLIAHGFLQSSANEHSLFCPVGTYPLTARDCSIACCNRISGTAPSHCRCFPVEKYQPICRYSEESAPLIFLCPLRNIPPSAVSHRAVCEQQDHR